MKAKQAAWSPCHLLSLGDYLGKQLRERGGGNCWQIAENLLQL